MSLFKSSGVIVNIFTSSEKEFLFDIFSYEYGKLKLKAKKTKKEKSLDVWYLINFEVNVKKENSIHEIKNIKIKNEFFYNDKNYEVIFAYLQVLEIINKKFPYSLPIYEIYNILSEINEYKNITEEKLIFSQCKLLSILWILPEKHKNISIEKILSFISKESINNILKLKWLDENLKNELKKIIFSSW